MTKNPFLNEQAIIKKINDFAAFLPEYLEYQKNYVNSIDALVAEEKIQVHTAMERLGESHGIMKSARILLNEYCLATITVIKSLPSTNNLCESVTASRASLLIVINEFEVPIYEAEIPPHARTYFFNILEDLKKTLIGIPMSYPQDYMNK